MNEGMPSLRPVSSACSRVAYGPSTTRYASSDRLGVNTEAGSPAALSFSESSLAQVGFWELLTWRYTVGAPAALSAPDWRAESASNGISSSCAGCQASGSQRSLAPPSIRPVSVNPLTDRSSATTSEPRRTSSVWGAATAGRSSLQRAAVAPRYLPVPTSTTQTESALSGWTSSQLP